MREVSVPLNNMETGEEMAFGWFLFLALALPSIVSSHEYDPDYNYHRERDQAQDIEQEKHYARGHEHQSGYRGQN